MLSYNQPIKEEKSYQGLQITEINPVMKLIIRGKKRDFLSAVGKSLNMVLPTKANTSTQSEKLTALWLSPDEWMIFSNGIVKENTNTYDTEIILNKNICKLNLGAVIDVTDQYVRIILKGDKIYFSPYIENESSKELYGNTIIDFSKFTNKSIDLKQNNQIIIEKLKLFLDFSLFLK